MAKKTKLPDGTDDMLEPLFDEGSEQLAKFLFNEGIPELVKELPVLKYGKVSVDLYTAFKKNKLRKRLTAFLGTLLEGEFSYDEFMKLNPEEREMVVEILMNELDNMNDNYQAEALALLFRAYVENRIDRLLFTGVAHELKNVNPLAFYFSVDSIQVTGETDKDEAWQRISSGPVHYLPSAFVSSSNERFETTSDNLLTNMGQVFLDIIYKPMQEKYSI